MNNEEPIDELLKRLEGLEAKATPGPWKCGQVEEAEPFEVMEERSSLAVTGCFDFPRETEQANAELTAVLRNTVPRLIREIRERDSRITALRAEVDGLVEEGRRQAERIAELEKEIQRLRKAAGYVPAIFELKDKP